MRRPHHDEGRTPREVETAGDAGRFAVDPDSEREAVPVAREAAAPRAGVAVGLKSASRWSLMDSGIDRDRRIRMNAPSDRLPALQSKMQEYIDNGVQLGWLIDPREEQVLVYRSESPVELLQRPQGVSADPLLPGFTLEMADIW